MSLILYSPAKINLFLRIVGRREDGFHNLASYFQAVDLFDRLFFSLSDSDELISTDPTIPCDSRNTILRAADVYRRATGIHFGIKVHLEKNIPQQAGLGGGSGNGATALYAINLLLGSPLTQDRLFELAAQVGSDVPFFFSTGSAYCTGRGEFVKSIELPPWLQNTSITLYSPPLNCSTPQIFKALDLSSCSKHSPEELLQSWQSGNPIYVNDLEKPAFQVCGALAELKRSLDFPLVGMTGSGSTFYCLGPEKSSANVAATKYQVKPIIRSLSSWYSAH